jgi:uncharacterized damage-inducible protein DinB
MDVQEKIEILDSLRNSQQVFLDALNGVPEDLAARSPGPGRWSILECAEHVAVSEEFLLAQVENAEPAATPAVNKPKEAAILARGADRERALVSPEAVRPTGRFSTLAAALQRFSTARAATIRFVENCTEDLRARLTTHPLLGPVNGHETLLLAAVHPLRHAKQIAEIKTAASVGAYTSRRTASSESVS